MVKKKKVVIVVSQDNRTLSHGGKTGWYVPEVAHPWAVFRKAGVRKHLVFASANGGLASPDEGSVKDYAGDKDC